MLKQANILLNIFNLLECANRYCIFFHPLCLKLTMQNKCHIAVSLQPVIEHCGLK